MKIMNCHGVPEELDLKQWIITFIDVNHNPPLKRPYKMKTTSDPALYKDYETIINEICNNYTNTVLLPAFMLNGTCVWCVDLDNHEEKDTEKSKEIDAFNNEVIEKANIRLDVMSGGTYQLVHQTEAYRKNTKAGLDIEVLSSTPLTVNP